MHVMHTGQAATSRHHTRFGANTPLGSVTMYKVSPDIPDIATGVGYEPKNGE